MQASCLGASRQEHTGKWFEILGSSHRSIRTYHSLHRSMAKLREEETGSADASDTWYSSSSTLSRLKNIINSLLRH